MTIKQKFSSIDQSKLTADQKAFLTKIKDVTKNFTDAEMNKKVEAPLNGFIEKAKEKMPEAIKSAPVKRTGKAKTSQTRKPKRTAMSLAKEIRKEGESWKEAQARASKMMKEDSKDLSKTVETELDKLSKLVRSQKSRAKLSGLSGTNIKRDSVRRAKPKGRRISKDGNVYYENRDNRTDRLAPNYPKNAPFLADGGYLTDPNFGTFQNQVLATGGSVTNERRYVNKGEDYEVRYSKPILRRKGYQGKRDFELGGTVVTDLAGHTGGGDAGLNAGMPLDGFSNTTYTGLVGETGAMSSGEMFMAGGSVSTSDLNDFLDRINKESDAKFRIGGAYGNYELWAIDNNGDEHRIEVGSRKDIKEALIKNRYNKKYTKYEQGGTLPSGSEQSYMITESFGNPAQHYARGGGVRQVGNREYSYGRNWTNDHRHVNKGEDHEVKYNRKGKFLGVFEGGGEIDSKNITMAKRTNVKKWYTKTYPTDDLGQEIKSDIDFWLLWKYMSQGYEIYNILGVYDSLVRERVFEKLSQILGIDYNVVYQKWLNSSKYARGGGVRRVGNREYSYGRNWTNDHRHVNKAEDHEVKYTRKGKFLGIFKEGGAIKNQYAGRTPEDIWNSLSVEQRKHFLLDHILGEEEIEQIKYRYAGEDNREFIDEYSNKEWKKLSGDVKQAFREHVKIGEYNKGGALTNERLHVNHDEDYEVRYAKPRPSRKGYKGARKFMAGGMNNETPRIYVADLEAYNNGRLVGEWLDLSDYNDADELMDAIQDVLKKSGGEEYAIHDYENFPSVLYSEYMSKNDFQALYDVMETAKENDLPLAVVQGIVSQYGEGAVDEFQGKYDNAEDFAYQLVDDLGIESFIDFERYLIISETDRRLLAQEMADSYVDDIRDEDGGNRLIEEAGMDVSEYEEADNQTQDEMLDRAREIVYDEYYDTWYAGLNDPYYFLVEEQGMYSADDFAKANFVQVDYEALADALEYDYTFVYSGGDLYVFNIR
jgi:antirestriction protein